MKNTNIPYWLKVESLTPINYYRYTSSVVDRLIEISNHHDFDNKHSVFFFEQLQEKVQSMFVDQSENQDKSGTGKIVWDNKVVIECLTSNGNKIFIGYYDWTYSIGLGVRSDDWIKPYKIYDK